MDKRPSFVRVLTPPARGSIASWLAWEGLLNPLTLRTNCNDAARISSSVTGGSKLKRILILRHTEATSGLTWTDLLAALRNIFSSAGCREQWATAVTFDQVGGLLSCRVRYEQFRYPAYEAPLLEAYGGRFESAFVMLHPFVRMPAAMSWRSGHTYPDDMQIVAHGSKCTWAEVYTQTGLSSCAKLNQALLASIGSLGEELIDFEACRQLKQSLESEPVWMPTEGRFEPLLQLGLLSAFEEWGCRELIFVPEFPDREEVRECSVASLKSSYAAFPTRGTLLPGDASFLFTVDWDSFFTLFYGPREFVIEVARRGNLEGFFAYAGMEHFWFNYSMGCATVTISPEHWPPAP